jgi:hypothetical protein
MKVVAVLLVVSILVAGCYGPSSRKRAAQLEYEKGLRLYNRYEFRAAKKAFEHSLWLNPNHAGARRYLKVVKRIMCEPEEIEVE